MTTIAVRDGVMACDSMESIEIEDKYDRAYYHSDKVYRIEFDDGGSVLVGAAGDDDGIQLWLAWFREGCEDDGLLSKMVDLDFDVILLYDDGSLQFSNGYGLFRDIHGEPFYAIGCGAKCALAAMYRGASAAEAVEIARLIDPHTGGEVKEFSFSARR